MAPLRRVLWFALVLPFLAAGCGGGDLTPRPVVEDPQSHIRTLGIQFMQFKGRNAGKPLSEAAFKKFLTGNHLQPDQVMVSPRDKQPYVVRYGLAGKAESDIVIYEKTGADGKRFAVTTMAGVQELDEAALKQAVPDAK